MSYDFSALVTDRTQGDVTRLKLLASKGYDNMTANEREEWDRVSLNGSYDAAVWNRVRSASNDLYERLLEAGEYASGYRNVALMGNESMPEPEEAQAYLGNLSALRNTLGALDVIPEPPIEMRGLTYEQANDIERLLVVIDRLIHRFQSIYQRAGMAWMTAGCGIYAVN